MIASKSAKAIMINSQDSIEREKEFWIRKENLSETPVIDIIFSVLLKRVSLLLEEPLSSHQQPVIVRP